MTFRASLAPGQRVLLHLNGRTDRDREDVRPWLLRDDGAGDGELTVALPADGILSYRLADVTDLPDDVGATRAGWLEVHRRGVPDPASCVRIPTPMGGDASVWYGPDAPWQMWPTAELAGWLDVAVDGCRVRVLPGDERVVVGFDGQFWQGLHLGAGVRAAGLGHTLVLVDNGVGEERAAHLTSAAGAAALLRRALRGARAVLGREVRRADVVVGQSYGGLAVAWLLAEHPELLGAGVVQSGSFWHRADARPPDRHGGEDAGDLVARLRSGDGDIARPVVVQVGTEEGGMVQQSRWYRDALVSRGAELSYREVAGGHDYAWWRHGLVDALAHLS